MAVDATSGARALGSPDVPDGGGDGRMSHARAAATGASLASEATGRSAADGQSHPPSLPRPLYQFPLSDEATRDFPSHRRNPQCQGLAMSAAPAFRESGASICKTLASTKLCCAETHLRGFAASSVKTYR